MITALSHVKTHFAAEEIIRITFIDITCLFCNQSYKSTSDLLWFGHKECKVFSKCLDYKGEKCELCQKSFADSMNFHDLKKHFIEEHAETLIKLRKDSDDPGKNELYVKELIIENMKRIFEASSQTNPSTELSSDHNMVNEINESIVVVELNDNVPITNEASPDDPELVTDPEKSHKKSEQSLTKISDSLNDASKCNKLSIEKLDKAVEIIDLDSEDENDNNDQITNEIPELDDFAENSLKESNLEAKSSKKTETLLKKSSGLNKEDTNLQVIEIESEGSYVEHLQVIGISEEIEKVVSNDDIEIIEEPHPVLEFADTTAPIQISSLFICPLCDTRSYYLTKASVQKHVDIFHKIPVDVQPQLNLKIVQHNLLRK